MLKIFLPILFIVITVSVSAQRVIDVTTNNGNVFAFFFSAGGEPFSNAKYIRVVEGSPYYNPEWMRGSVMLKDSNEYINILLRLDLLANKIEYIDKNGAQMVATTEIKEIRLVDSSTGKSVRFVHSSVIASKNIEPGWYQLLVSGKAGLYKRLFKDIQESKPYGSATTEQRITTLSQYYLLNNNSFTRLKKIKEIPELLVNKKKELLERISAIKLTGKTDVDFNDLVVYYNQLNQQ